jgi:predicted 3-demethylubiquinone-9 3-methyltransferase (glyoxalase superfamily)
MQKITPFLWFDGNAEDAILFYTSVFKDSKVLNTMRYGEMGPGPAGSLMTATLELNGQEFMVLNGGPQFKFTEAISFFLRCETQQEIDEYWAKLSAGGEQLPCGWLKDKFGLCWQIVPTVLERMMNDKDARKSQRVMHAMLKMRKLDIETLQKAYNNVPNPPQEGASGSAPASRGAVSS